MEVFEQKQKIVVAYSEHKMDMAESKITPAGKSGQVIGKICCLNLLARDVLLKSDLDKEGMEEYVLGLELFSKTAEQISQPAAGECYRNYSRNLPLAECSP